RTGHHARGAGHEAPCTRSLVFSAMFSSPSKAEGGPGYGTGRPVRRPDAASAGGAAPSGVGPAEVGRASCRERQSTAVTAVAGRRAFHVTGVQTCALPISRTGHHARGAGHEAPCTRSLVFSAMFSSPSKAEGGPGYGTGRPVRRPDAASAGGAAPSGVGPA